MSGFGGNDTYIVDSSKDVVIEVTGSGTDKVQSSVSYTLTSNVEYLELTGNSAINGSGNDLNNIINGNSAGNILNGNSGADTMYGGTGSDTYIVDSSGDVVVEYATSGSDKRIHLPIPAVSPKYQLNLFKSIIYSNKDQSAETKIRLNLRK